MAKNKWGRIINIASISSKITIAKINNAKEQHKMIKYTFILS